MDTGSPVLQLQRAESRVHAGVVTLVLLSLGHFLVDLYSGSLGVLQPFIVERFGLSLTQAGMLGGILVFSSSVTQPLYGYLSDRYQSRLFCGLGPAVAGVFVLGASQAPSFLWAAALMIVGGAGVSAFHPQASSWAAAGMKKDRAQWMAVFISAGALGIALAPALFKEWIGRLGFARILWAAAPGVLVSGMILALVAGPRETRPRAGGRGSDWAALRAVARPLVILYFCVFFRSAVQVVYAQFLVLYLSRERGFSLHDAAYTLTCYLTCGAIGGFAGGRLSDRFGAKRVIVSSFAGSVPLMSVFFLTNSPLGVISLILGGLVLLFTIPINVVVAQQLAPSQAGTVSALLMGFAWGAAGMIFVPLAGWVADHFSMHAALASLLVFPALGFVLSRRLPEDLGS